MKLSWLEPAMISAARTALIARHLDWDAHFSPVFVPPPRPVEVPAVLWPRVAEHVARAERVSALIRAEGLEASLAEFGESNHAIEIATMISAAAQVDGLSYELCESLLRCPVDEFIVYGTFLTLLVETAGDRDPVVESYESFCEALTSMTSDLPWWHDRVCSARDGLANLYVIRGRYDDGDSLFKIRHAEDVGDVAVALTASRSFLAAGEVGRTIQWLGIGAERAAALGRTAMEDTLRKKQVTLRARLS